MMKSSEVAARRSEDLTGEPDPVLQRAAVLVVAGVDRGVEELLDQVPPEGGHLDAVPPESVQSARGFGEPLDERHELLGGEHDRNLAVHSLGQVGHPAQRDTRQQ
jgi:hypothetical protein